MKKIILIVASSVAGIVLIVGLLELTNTINLFGEEPNSAQSTTENESTDMQPDEETAEESEQTESTNETSPAVTTPTPAPQPTQASPQIDLDVSYESGGTIRLFAKVYGVESGDCAVTISNNGVESNQTDTIYYDGGDYGSCAGFSERKDKMGAGEWVWDFSVTTNGQTYTASTTYLVP